MQKTITIGGKDIIFKSSATFPIIFKNQFGYDILTILMPVISEILKGCDVFFEEIKTENFEIKPSIFGELLENVYSLEMVDLLNLIWAMAKSADKDIPEPLKWYDEFDEFPIYDVAKELAEILLPSLISKKKLMKIKQTLIKTKPQT